jgi:hypothetical protein
MTYTVPRGLLKLQPWLKSQTLESQESIKYSKENWRAKFRDADLESVLSKHPEKINRAQLHSLAKAAFSTDWAPKNVKQLFWGVMLWGYGTTSYGPYRLERIFKTTPEQNISSVLCQAFQYLTQGKVEAAYDMFYPQGTTSIKYFSEAFFTKYLYFAGIGCGVKRYPLIFDSRVAEGLKTLLGKDSPQSYTQQGYITYVNLLHEWAKKLDCRADSIEYLIFSRSPDYWSE